MSLKANQPVGLIPTSSPAAAREFFEIKLGLTFVADDGFAMIFRLGVHDGAGASPGIMLRVARVGEFTPLPFTIFGWEAPDIEAAVDELVSKGIEFLRFSFLEQDARGIWKAPGGADAVAWFKDPDGNTLSLSRHSGQ